MADPILIGDRYGRLAVISLDHRLKSENHWLVKCDCGTERVIRSSALRSGHTKSCGCLARELTGNRRRKHGESHKTQLYTIWCNMRARCLRPRSSFYYRYGGRGITICTDWAEYLTFKKWAEKHGYKVGLSIDRIDNDGNYEPSNCRWVKPSEQAKNTSRTHFVTLFGKTACLKDHAEEQGVSYDRAKDRLRAGWSVEDAFTLPKQPRRPGRRSHG